MTDLRPPDARHRAALRFTVVTSALFFLVTMIGTGAYVVLERGHRRQTPDDGLPALFEPVRRIDSDTVYVRDRDTGTCFLAHKIRNWENSSAWQWDYTTTPCPPDSRAAGNATP